MSSDDQEPSIYNAPEADTSQASSDSLLSAYVGPKRAEFYAARFEKFANGGSSTSWHWPTFFLSSAWFLYRKMWLNAFLYWIVFPLAMLIVLTVLMMRIDEVTATAIYYGVYVLVAFVLVPIFANRLYYKHVSGNVDKINATNLSFEQKAMELERKGGTSIAAYVVLIIPFIIGIVAAISIPAYNDYTQRAQVAEGLNLAGGAKVAVTEYSLENDAWPATNAEAGLAPPEEISGNYVSQVIVDDGTINIVYGENAESGIAGKSLILKPSRGESGTVEWQCASPYIEPRHLPAACRP